MKWAGQCVSQKINIKVGIYFIEFISCWINLTKISKHIKQRNAAFEGVFCKWWHFLNRSSTNAASPQRGELDGVNPGETTPESPALLETRCWRRAWGRRRLPTIIGGGGGFVQVANRQVDLGTLSFMYNSRVEMLNRSSLSLHLQKNVLNKILILIDEVEAKRTIILIKSQPHWCGAAECHWSLKFMLLEAWKKGLSGWRLTV